MSGIYVHIPYCKVKCHYCDFHFSTNTSGADDMIEAICSELRLRKNYLSQPVETIYFGGGTPSFLSNEQLGKILETIHNNFHVSADHELTFECNPDDLNAHKLESLKNFGVNRLSIGIQSFDDDVLKMMNRAHTSAEALTSIKLAQDIGIDNITVDLIYGIPDRDLEYWKRQLETVIKINVPHISSYCLTIEPKTVFGHKFRFGELKVPDDETTLTQFKMMINSFKDAGYLHYEISNFAKEGYISKHNSAYWLGKKYLGVGPSAHSYNQQERGWNISNNHLYIRKVANGFGYYDTEELTDKDQFNDYILTRLRTHWGVDLSDIELLGTNLDLSSFQRELDKHLELQNIIQVNNIIRLSEHGKFIADRIAADLFV